MLLVTSGSRVSLPLSCLLLKLDGKTPLLFFAALLYPRRSHEMRSDDQTEVLRVAEEQGCGVGPQTPLRQENRVSCLWPWQQTTSERPPGWMPNYWGHKWKLEGSSP